MKLVGIVGHKQAGKDTLFRHLRQALPDRRVHRFAFADAIKREVLRFLRGSGFAGDLEYMEQNKELFRPLWQWWGTEYRRKLFGEDYWIRRLAETLDGSYADVAIITDVRFLHEADFVRARGGLLVGIHRPETFTADPHASESEQLDIQVDQSIINTTLPNLQAQVRNLAEKL